MSLLRSCVAGLVALSSLASCSLALKWGELSDARGESSDSGADAVAREDGPVAFDDAGEASVDATEGDAGAEATADAGGYCDKLRASPAAATLRFCRDFDDGDLGEFVGTVNTPHTIDSTSFFSPPSSVAFRRPLGKVGDHLDVFERAALATTPHKADYSVALRASVPNNNSGFVVRMSYGGYDLTYNVYGANGGAVIDKNNAFRNLSPQPFIEQWGTFRFLVDFDAKVFRVFVNGIDAFGVAYPLPMPASPPNGLLFRIELFGDDAASKVNWDNVSIFAE
ncbi:MAG: hypothetical protein KBF88_17710 [Polyangiaceae bacterium]|nr:hypothetical protein [Polyangiaceae bacterium]